MKPFRYERASGIASACASAAQPNAKFIAGGTNLLDLMKLQIETPAHLVDIASLPLAEIEETAEGGLRIGTRVTNSALAADMRVRRLYPLLSRRSSRVRQRSFATRPRLAGISSSEHDVRTSMTRPNPAISARRARAAPPWAASTG